ncbi:hypothetical protein CLV51_1153 [Chitinophaga niastensis]|uniref:Uncharacterized protein n=1 Tax=Chitinophaga niastensis TaxID=536980 RepID=A0A2P8H7T6_CHINA|nr:hypothetical protein [Chitinophaga niastensis]PSL42295.1 hypothetical protein CLV51_1153 [Chitinophaga niastensis]
MYDDAARNASKHFFKLPSYNLDTLIKPHAATALYLYSSTGEKLPIGTRPPYKVFHSNNSIWEALHFNQLQRTDVSITLDSFFLFEWFPRSPGLYYTPKAREARREAQGRIISSTDGIVVYDHHGKMSMLDGGVGNIRLKPIIIDGSEYYLMSASNNGNCEEGFPVAIPVGYYNQFIDEIVSRGAVVKNITGKLRHIPDSHEKIYDGYTDVSKVFLQVEDVKEARHPKSRDMEDLRVSVAVSFISNYQGDKAIYASYVTFDPSETGSFERSIRWMEDDYVGKLYDGKIITDFDQVRSHFRSAPFSLSKVMELSLNEKQLNRLGLPYDFSRIIQTQKSFQILIENLNFTHMENNKYKTVNSQVGAMGDNAHAENFVQQSSITDNIDLNALAAELTKLRQHAKQESTDAPEHDEQIGALATAESAAKKGDKSKVMSALSTSGKWLLEIAEKIGVGLAVSVIKEATGIKP